MPEKLIFRNTHQSPRDYGKCQAPSHVVRCDGWATTIDHFTPISIAKVLGWTEAQIEDPLNRQYLSAACHAEKDKTTAERLSQVKEQLRGKMIAFGEHIT